MVKNVAKKAFAGSLIFIKKIYTFCGLHIKAKKMKTKIQKQIEERINEKICESEMNIDIDRFIKELKSLNMGAYD